MRGDGGRGDNPEGGTPSCQSWVGGALEGRGTLTPWAPASGATRPRRFPERARATARGRAPTHARVARCPPPPPPTSKQHPGETGAGALPSLPHHNALPIWYGASVTGGRVYQASVATFSGSRSTHGCGRNREGWRRVGQTAGDRAWPHVLPCRLDGQAGWAAGHGEWEARQAGSGGATPPYPAYR